MGTKGRVFFLLVFGLVGVLMAGAYARAWAEDDSGAAALRSRAFRMRHLSNAEAKARLESLKIGASIDLLPHNSLIVTAKDVNDLVKASSLLKLADSADAYRVEVIADWAGTSVLPSTEQISSRGGLSNVGTLLAPPSATDGIIIDVHNGKIIAAAPSSQFERVKGVFAAMAGLSIPGAVAVASANEAGSPLELAALPARVRTGPPAPAATAAVDKDAMQKQLLQTLSAPQKPAPSEVATAEQEAAEALAKAIRAEELAQQKQQQASEAALAVKAEEKAAAIQTRGGVFSGWGPTVASAQPMPTPISSPRIIPLAAEVEIEMPAAEAGLEAGAEGEDTIEADVEGEAAMEGVAEDAGDMEGDAETDGDAEAGEEDPMPGDEEPAEPAVTDVPVSDDDTAKFMELVKLLQQSAAAEESAADQNETGNAAADEPITAQETAAPPVITAPVRPALPAPRGPAGSRIPPQTTVAPAKIETLTDAATGPDIIPDAEKELQTVIVLPEKVEILALIEMVGKQLGLNYMFDPKNVAGDVMLKIHDGKIKVKDMYALLESVLRFRNLAMTRRGNLVTIMPAAEASAYDPVLWRDSGDVPQPGNVIATTIYQLKNIDTGTAQLMLTNMKLGITFNAIEETQTLIVTDYAYRMSRIEEILKLVDVKGKMRKYHSRKLEYLTPSEMASKVMAIAQQMGTLSITVSQEVTAAPVTAAPAVPGRAVPATVRPPTPVRPAPTARSGGDAGVYIEVDDRTNRILMVGLEEDIITVNMIIDSLDVEKYGLKAIREYPMQYVEATDLLDTLYELGIISSQPTARTSALPSRMGATTQRTATVPAGVRQPVTTPAGTYTPVAAAAGEPQISVRLSTNSLLVNATLEHHREIEMLIRFVDIEQQDVRTVHQYEIQYVDIHEVVKTLGDLGIVEQQSTGGSTPRRAGTTTTQGRVPTAPGMAPVAAGAGEGPGPTTTFEATTGAEITSNQPQIAVLESTNSLLVYATPKQHETINLVVTHVDRELTSTSTPYVVYALENQDPEELAATLNEIVQATLKDTAKSPDSKIQTAASTGGAIIPPKREKNEVQIVADPKTYSIIVYADKKNQQWISDLIQELDAYRPQVLLDVTLVEISKTDKFAFDLQTAVRSAGSSAFEVLTPEFTGSLLTGLLPNKAVSEAAVISGQGFGFFADKHVEMLLTAIQAKSYGRILARPTLLVDDNQEGTLDAKTITYIPLTRTTYVPAVGTGGNPVSTPVQDTEYQPYEAGLSLAIKPHISKGDNLSLDITLTRSDFLNLDSSTSKPPNTVTNDIVTKVTVPDSATIILGGLERINQSKGGSKVPILGDIPLIGGLFRSTDNRDEQSKLYVFIKAHILRPGSDLTSRAVIDISNKNRRAFEKKETEMQEYQDWPGAKPKPMDPLHVLEQDDAAGAPKRILEDDEYRRLNAEPTDKPLTKARRKEDAVTVEVNLDAPPQSSPWDIVDDAY
ncbi:MAG: hypothetical protein IH624_04460 [Phycisphaerae bacterium]|nr:hypothetical protein [Phycisphaerae bacterium]